MYATRELGEVRIIVCRSMLASDSGEMDRARFLLSRGVSLGLENRDTVDTGEVKGHSGGLKTYTRTLDCSEIRVMKLCPRPLPPDASCCV